MWPWTGDLRKHCFCILPQECFTSIFLDCRPNYLTVGTLYQIPWLFHSCKLYKIFPTTNNSKSVLLDFTSFLHLWVDTAHALGWVVDSRVGKEKIRKKCLCTSDTRHEDGRTLYNYNKWVSNTRGSPCKVNSRRAWTTMADTRFSGTLRISQTNMLQIHALFGCWLQNYCCLH